MKQTKLYELESKKADSKKIIYNIIGIIAITIGCTSTLLHAIEFANSKTPPIKYTNIKCNTKLGELSYSTPDDPATLKGSNCTAVTEGQ